ncbi:T9SS type A sorting domain-containing protein [Rufibacter latericius]|uniref:T9SS type A sorting domain-containing protein n=1 Tax=Rufibacter latericius TaxID=2487040 RepID=UPI001402EDA5|nr:T9SS type A sorting domain-containing protein [Rufibacter latericius]
MSVCQVLLLVWAFAIFKGAPALAESSVPYSTGDYRTVSAGSIGQEGSNNLLEQLTSSGTWVPVTGVLPNSATLHLEHSTQISETFQVANLYIASQKTFTVPAGTSLIITGKFSVSSAAEVVQEGEIENRGVLQLKAAAKLTIKTPTYKASSPIWAGSEEIDVLSEVRIEAASANTLLFSTAYLSAQTHGYWFGRLTVAPALANSQWQLTDSSGPLAAQAFSTSLPATSSLLLLAAPNLSLQFGRDVTLTGGTYFLQNQGSGTGTMTVAGQMVLQNAVLTLNQTATSAAISTLDLKGNLVTDAASTIQNSSTVNTSASGIKFTGTNWQTIQASGPINHVSLALKGGSMVKLGQHLRLNPTNSVYAGTLSVESGAILDFGLDASNNGYQVQGQGYFSLNQGGTLYITSPQGINATGAMGNVQVTESRRAFNQLATFVYSGKVPQQTGNAFPATASGKIIIIDNPTSVTLTNTLGISNNTAISPQGGRLEIKQGTFMVSPSADVTGSGKLVMTGGTFQTNVLNTIVPQLTGAYELTGGTLELAGNGNQTLRGGSNYTYHQVLVSGTNESNSTAKTISTTTTINQNLTILPNAVLDISNKTLKGEGGLTMTGGLFRTSKTSSSLPELAGKNAPYILTGGTIEFYGSINGQNQSIRGTYGNSQKITYHHLLLTANEANTQNEVGNHLFSANFDLAGTLTVKAPAVLQIASNRAVGGTGNFVLEAGATLLYGSPQGIKQTGTGTSDGNVRVSGTRFFSPQASYGFIGNSEMVSGDALPGTVANLLVAKLAGGVTLSKTVNVSNVFTHKSGLFKTDVHELSLLRQDTAALQMTDYSFYMQGTLRRAVGSSGTYSFPVGNASGKRKVDLVSIGLTGNGFQSIAVSFKPLTNHQNADMFLVENSYSYTHVETEGVWNVVPNAVPSEGSFTIKTSLQGFTNVSDNKFALLVRPQNATSAKEWTTGGGSLDAPGKEGRTVTGGYAKRNFVMSFGQFALATMETVLPVTWLYVKAERKNQQVHLQWATASEVNNDRYEVEFSLDGKNFTSAGKVAGAGNSTIEQKYEFQHSSSATATSYYRIKQIDFDGGFEYSKVVAVQSGRAALAQVTLYPNPSQDYLYLGNLTLDASATVEILDVQGKTINRAKPTLDGGTPVISVQQLQAGNYILRIKTNHQLVQQRFVKL